MNEEDEISEKILDLFKKYKPNNVEDLLNQAEQTLGISKKITLEKVVKLENQGILKLNAPKIIIPSRFEEYIFTHNALWFWVTVILSLTTMIAIFIIPEKAYPYVYIRYILGFVFVLFLPGSSLIKTIFPTKEINVIERTTLSVGTSLALVPLIGLLLNYTPWGIKLIPIIISLLMLIISFAIIGLRREHQMLSART